MAADVLFEVGHAAVADFDCVVFFFFGNTRVPILFMHTTS